MTANHVAVVIKFSDNTKIQHRAISPIPECHVNAWDELRTHVRKQWGGELVARSVFASVSLEDIEALKSVACARSEIAGIHYAPPKFENYLSLTYQATAVAGVAAGKREAELADVTQFVMKVVSSWINVEQCYDRPDDVDPSLRRTTRPLTFAAPNTDPGHTRQAHLLDAPLGVGVTSLWQFEGADGAGQRFIDIERGWKLDHKDLSDAEGRPRVRLIPGNGVISTEAENVWHGTCVLGIVCATHNGIDVIGMAPRLASMEVVSYVDAADIGSSASAVMYAASRQIERDITPLTSAARSGSATVRGNVVILIEAQALPPRQHFYFPVEIYPETFDAIALATHAGITVIEPAGNGRARPGSPRSQSGTAVDLDQLDQFFSPALGWKTPPKSLLRPAPATHAVSIPSGLAPFADSGAIMVACAEHPENGPDQWTRSQPSNFGARVDCFAAGEAVRTLDAKGGNRYEFGGTSSASAIIAGAALCLQGVAHTNLSQPLSPENLRKALSDVECGSRSAGGLNEKIGVMPDLMKIAAKWIDHR